MTPLQIDIDIENAVKTLQEGGLLLYPTDTVWGLGCDATNVLAVKKLYELKQRPCAKAMISLVDSIASLSQWVETIPSVAIEEMENAASPLTIIYDSPVGIAESLRAEDGSAAFRIPQFDFTKVLCRRFGNPIVSTSANISEMPTPKVFKEIDPALIEAVDYVCVSGRDMEPSVPSRILKITDKGERFVIR